LNICFAKKCKSKIKTKAKDAARPFDMRSGLQATGKS